MPLRSTRTLMSTCLDSRVTETGAVEGDHGYSVIIVAGGFGTRLGGVDKASVILKGETLLARVRRRVRSLTDDVIIVVRASQAGEPGIQTAAEGARIVTDLEGHSGVLAAIAAGQLASRHDWSLVVACDMPFLQVLLIQYMWSLHDEVDVIVPRLAVGMEPLHAFYHRRSLPALCDALARGRRRATSFYDSLRIRHVDESDIARHDPEGLSFLNINTPEDLSRAQALLEKKTDLASRP